MGSRALILYLVIYLAICCQSNLATKGEQFRKSTGCPGQVVSPAYRYGTVLARSLLECTSLCLPDDHCLSIVFDRGNGICYHGNQTAEENCSNMESASDQLKFYERKISPPKETSICESGGRLNPTGTCTCLDGFFGEHCEKYIVDCVDGVSQGIVKESGIYAIKPLRSPSSFPIYCQVLANNLRTIILSRQDETVTFNRTWTEYRNGFGQLTKDHWLGLEKIHQLTSSMRYDLRFLIRPPKGDDLFSTYLSFCVNDESSGYSISLSECETGALSDCLSDLQGTRFSAYDDDSDNNQNVNCASVYGGGWWFKGANCSKCNVVGSVLSPANGYKNSVLGDIFWEGFGTVFPIKISVYLLRD